MARKDEKKNKSKSDELAPRDATGSLARGVLQRTELPGQRVTASTLGGPRAFEDEVKRVTEKPIGKKEVVKLFVQRDVPTIASEDQRLPTNAALANFFPGFGLPTNLPPAAPAGPQASSSEPLENRIRLSNAQKKAGRRLPVLHKPGQPKGSKPDDGKSGNDGGASARTAHRQQLLQAKKHDAPVPLSPRRQPGERREEHEARRARQNRVGESQGKPQGKSSARTHGSSGGRLQPASDSTRVRTGGSLRNPTMEQNLANFGRPDDRSLALRRLPKTDCDCANCGQHGHELADCAWPSNDGLVHGCPFCNLKDHEDQCPRYGIAWDTLHVVDWAVSRRANKPPLAVFRRWARHVRDALTEPMSRVAFPPGTRFPWTEDFPQELARRGEFPWESTNDTHELPCDPITGNIRVTKELYRALTAPRDLAATSLSLELRQRPAAQDQGSHVEDYDVDLWGGEGVDDVDMDDEIIGLADPWDEDKAAGEGIDFQ